MERDTEEEERNKGRKRGGMQGTKSNISKKERRRKKKHWHWNKSSEQRKTTKIKQDEEELHDKEDIFDNREDNSKRIIN